MSVQDKNRSVDYRRFLSGKVPLLHILLLAVVYCGSSSLGLRMTVPGTNVALIYLPVGIMMAAMMLYGIRIWPAIALGACACNLPALLADYSTGDAIAMAAGQVLADVVQVVLGAYLYFRFGGARNPLCRAADVNRFIVFAALLPQALGAFIGVASLWLGRTVGMGLFGSLWLNWFTSNVASVLVVAPLILVWHPEAKQVRVNPHLRKYGAVYGLTSLCVCAGIMANSASSYDYFILFSFLFVIWTTLAFNQRGATVSVFTIAAVAVTSTAMGLGLFIRNSPVESIIFWESFLAVVAVAAMTLSAALSDRQQFDEALRETESLRQTTLKAAMDGFWRVDMQGCFLEVNAAYCLMSGYEEHELLGRNVALVEAIEQSAETAAHIQKIIRQGGDRFETVHRRKDGSHFSLEVSVLYQPAAGGSMYAFLRDISERIRTEQLLARERLLLASLKKNIPDTVFVKDRECRFVWVNAAKARLHGYDDAESLIGKSDLDLFAPEHFSASFAVEQQVMTTGQPVVIPQEKVIWADGHVTWVSTTKAPLTDADGKIIGLLGISRDISDLRQAEEALVERERQLATLMSNLPGMAYHCRNDGDWTMEFVSDGAKALTGYSPQELVGNRKVSYASLIHPADREAVWNQVQASLKRKEPFVLSYRLCTAAGEQRWVWEQGQGVFDPHDKVLVLEGLVVDITDRRSAEEARQQLMVAIDQAGESIVFTDLVGNILYVNQGFEKVTGYARQEVVGRNPRFLKGDGQTAGFYKDLWDTIARGEVWHGHFTNKRKDGALFEEEATISPVLDPRGKVVSYVAVKRDVTREVQLERQFIEVQKMEAFGQLAGGVAHDYNNILAAIMMQLDMLLSEPDLKPDMREGLASLKDCSNRAANLTRQLLMFSRRQVAQIKPVELNQMLDEEFKMLRRLLGEHIDFSIQASVRDAWVYADPGMMQQVIMNLCINARDAMPKGGRLSVSIRRMTLTAADLRGNREARAGEFVVLTVADTGCGMSEETKTRIFEPFFTTKEVGKGTGLGLATVYGIVKQHKGWLEVTSDLGMGSEFRVFLPAGAGAAAVASGDQMVKVSRGTETILIVEDDEVVRAMMAMCLKAAGYRVFPVANGTDALLEWRGKLDQIDLLLTDMIMPGGITGLELAEELKKIKPILPVIITSGYSVEIAEMGIPEEAGFAYLPKPAQLSVLTATVRKLLDESLS